MKTKIIFIIIIFSTSLIKSQTTINFNQLVFKNEIAFYKNSKYSGSACDKSNLCINYKNGLKEGKVKRGNTILTYNQNYVIDVKFTDSTDKVLFQKSFDKLEKVTNAFFTIFIEGEINDTIYKNNITNKDSLMISIGLIVKYNKNKSDFIQAKDFKLKECSISGVCFIDWLYIVKNSYFPVATILRIKPKSCEKQILYFENIKFTYLNNKTFNIGTRSLNIK